MDGNMYETTCKDKVGRDGRSYRGCGQKITMYNNGVKWNAYSVIKTPDGDGNLKDQWVEHGTVCEARKQVQQQQPPPQQQFIQPPMPNVGASLPRDATEMREDRQAEILHQIGLLLKQQSSIVFLLQEVAKKLGAFPKDANDPNQDNQEMV